MSVNILHHGRCFDGASSAALFAAFTRQTLGCTAKLRFVPKHHCRGNPFEESDFRGEWSACVDFRYSQHPQLRWYFDHHRSAFAEPGDREHFEADRSGQKFHDPSASSCAQYLAQIAHHSFGFDASPYQELIHWADLIDAARFPDPQSAIGLDVAAMQLASYIQCENDLDTISGFIEDLLRYPLDTIAKADYVRRVMRPRKVEHQQNIQAVAQAASVEGELVVYDLFEESPRVLNHFIPYFHHPQARYAVGGYQHQDKGLRITVGFNPWHPSGKREHDLAAICERFGGGGHPYVAGCSFAKHEQKAARAALREICQHLQPSQEGRVV